MGIPMTMDKLIYDQNAAMLKQLMAKTSFEFDHFRKVTDSSCDMIGSLRGVVTLPYAFYDLEMEYFQSDPSVILPDKTTNFLESKINLFNLGDDSNAQKDNVRWQLINYIELSSYNKNTLLYKQMVRLYANETGFSAEAAYINQIDITSTDDNFVIRKLSKPCTIEFRFNVLIHASVG